MVAKTSATSDDEGKIVFFIVMEDVEPQGPRTILRAVFENIRVETNEDENLARV